MNIIPVTADPLPPLDVITVECSETCIDRRWWVQNSMKPKRGMQ